MTFAEKLKELRERRGMTQERLAVASDVSLGAIRDYEQGRKEPVLSGAQRLARVLGVSLDDFPASDAGGGKAAPSSSKKKKARAGR
jgi:transcriptional regulator with XRE-family HTH domain